MTRSLRLSLASCLLIGVFVGCKAESDSATAPRKTVDSSPEQGPSHPQAAWSVEQAVVDAPPSSAPAEWSSSPYNPTDNRQAPAEPVYGSAPPVPSSEFSSAPDSVDAEATVVSSPPPQMDLPYDPALDAAGTGRRARRSFSDDATPRIQKRQSNPLRADDSIASSAEPNPLRYSAPQGYRASQDFHSYAPGSSDNPPAGGSAPPTRALVADEPAEVEAQEPAAPSPSAYSMRSAMPTESYASPAAPEAAAAEAPPVAAAASPAPHEPMERAEAENMAMMAMGEPPTTPPAASEPPAAASPAASADPFDTVQVFYGTDRLAWQPNADSWTVIAVRFWPALAAIGVAALFGIIASLWKHWLSAGLSFCILLVAAGLGFTATSTTLECARLAEKEGVRYLAERAVDGEVQLGICDVTIPKTHAPGELEAPSAFRLEFREDQSKHVVLNKTEHLQAGEFYSRLRERVSGSQDEELFVFVHGFNVSFEDAARRTAQMAHDLKYEGAPVFFSWPANNKFLLSYAQDETNVSWAAPHLKRFLLDVARNSNAKSINVIAHSMGNRALATVLREIELEMRDDARLFNQVVLAAPDIDADDFRLNIAPHIQKTSRRITLYASSNDKALAASQLVHRYPRAGDSGEVLVVVPGIETIDVSAIDGGPWGHSYYGSSDPILKDLAVLFAGDDATPRSWLAAQDYQGISYWVFQAQAASARAAGAGGVLH